MITVQAIVDGLIKQGYKEIGGSDVFRILIGIKRNYVKVYYDDYDAKNFIIIREFERGYDDL